MRDKKYSRLVGRVARFKIFKVHWKRRKVRITQVYLEEIKDEKYSRLGGMDER